MARPTEMQRANASFVNAPVKVTISGTSAKTAQLSPGAYTLHSDTDCYFIQGATGDSADANDIPLRALGYVDIDVRGDGDDDDFVHVIQASAGGTLWVIQAQ